MPSPPDTRTPEPTRDSMKGGMRVCQHDDPDNTGGCIHCGATTDPTCTPFASCGCPQNDDGPTPVHWPDCEVVSDAE